MGFQIGSASEKNPEKSSTNEEDARVGKFNEIGWLSTVGIQLNQQCVKCRVWVGVDGKQRQTEFDGMPHHCDAQKSKTAPNNNDRTMTVDALG